MMILAVLYMIGAGLWIVVGVADLILSRDRHHEGGWMILVGTIGLFGVLIGAGVCGGFP